MGHAGCHRGNSRQSRGREAGLRLRRCMSTPGRAPSGWPGVTPMPEQEGLDLLDRSTERRMGAGSERRTPRYEAVARRNRAPPRRCGCPRPRIKRGSSPLPTVWRPGVEIDHGEGSAPPARSRRAWSSGSSGRGKGRLVDGHEGERGRDVDALPEADRGAASRRSRPDANSSRRPALGGDRPGTERNLSSGPAAGRRRGWPGWLVKRPGRPLGRLEQLGASSSWRASSGPRRGRPGRWRAT